MDMDDRGGRRSMATTIMLQKASLSKKRRPPSCTGRIALIVLLALSSEMMDVVGAFDNTIQQNHAKPEDRSSNFRPRIKEDNTTSSVNQTIISSATEEGHDTKAPHNTTTNENGEGTANDENEGPSGIVRTIQLVFGWGIVAVGGLSLVVYAYAFYLRNKYAKLYLQEQMEEKRKVEAFENGSDNLSPCCNNSPTVEQTKRSSSPTSVRTGNSIENKSAPGEGTTPFDDDFFF